jgi:hypothetical protein
MADDSVHIVPGGRPAVRAPRHPGRGRLRRRAPRRPHAPFLPAHGVATPGLNGHGAVLRAVAAQAHAQAAPPTPDPSPPRAARAGGGETQAHEPAADADDVMAFLAKQLARGKKK